MLVFNKKREIDFEKTAKEVLGIREPWKSSADCDHNLEYSHYVPAVAAAMSAAYGMGVGVGKAMAKK